MVESFHGQFQMHVETFNSGIIRRSFARGFHIGHVAIWTFSCIQLLLAFYIPPRRPMIIASTNSPFFMECVPVSLELGKAKRPFAPRRLPTLELR